jgi:hypothetical protein
VYTPGPWIEDHSPHPLHEDAYRIRAQSDGEPVADILRGIVCDENARLLLAAPDMLEALEALRKLVVADYDLQVRLASVKDLILAARDKAMGE